MSASADALLTTTRSVRRRLDLDRPVPAALIRECVEIALQAAALGIPYERITQVALLPVAWYRGTSFGKSLRRPLAEVLHWDLW